MVSKLLTLHLYRYFMLKHTDSSQRNSLSASRFPQTLSSLQLSSTSNHLTWRRVLLPWLSKGRTISYIILIENATALGKLMAWPEFSKPTHCSTQVETAYSNNLSHKSRTSVGIHSPITGNKESILATCMNLKTKRCTRTEPRFWATNPYYRLTVPLHSPSVNRRKNYESA